jgi:hypothetical protein
MKQIAIIAMTLGCWLTTAKAQTAPNADKEVRDVEVQRFHAMEKADVATLDRIISDDLIYTHSSGLRQSKFDVIGVLGGDMKYESITPYDVRVRIYDGTAIVAGRASINIRAHGETESFEICYLDVYVKQESRWSPGSRHG